MFKTKLMVAALAAGLSGMASAAITPTSSGNAEFAFSAFVGDVGYTYDLADIGFNSVFGSDVRMNSLIGSGNQTPGNAAQLALTSISLTQSVANGIVFDLALPGFSDFITLAGGAAGVQWSLFNGESSGVRRIIQTVSTTPTTRLVTSGINTAVENVGNYYASNNAGGTHTGDFAVDGYRITQRTDQLAFAGNIVPAAAATYGSVGALDEALDIYVVRGNTATPNTGLGGFAQLVGANGGDVVAKVYVGDAGEYRFQIAVVPEPETYAMLLAGLGLIGVAARRARRT